MTFDYEGTLRARVIVGGTVRADDLITDHMSEEQLNTISEAHEYVARQWLARGSAVELESRHLDGSLFALTILSPRPDLPDGFETTYRGEFSP